MSCNHLPSQKSRGPWNFRSGAWATFAFRGLYACASSFIALGCAPADDSADPSPMFGNPLNPVNGAGGNGQSGLGNTPPVGANGGANSEGNPLGNGTPLGNGQGGVNAGAGGTGSNGVTGTAGAGTAGTGTGGAGQPLEPPIGPVTNPAEIAQFFASFPCGAKYTALGDGGWQFCLRLADGGGACANGSEVFQRVSFAGGGALPDVAQVSGFADGSIAVVTAGGALHTGGSVTGISPTALIASGVVNFSGGYHGRVALVDEGTGFGVRSWADNGTPAPVALPNGASPVQVSANYGLGCALSTAGDVYCWDLGGNHGLGLTAAPSRIALAKPVKLMSVGQNSVCGVSFDDTLECQAAWYDNPYLPTEAAGQSFQVRQASFPAVREIHAGFRQGIIVRGDGAAFFLPGNGAGADNPGVQFAGATDVIAAGGDRGNACVQTRAGSVYCMVSGATRQATLGGAPLTAQAAACAL